MNTSPQNHSVTNSPTRRIAPWVEEHHSNKEFFRPRESRIVPFESNYGGCDPQLSKIEEDGLKKLEDRRIQLESTRSIDSSSTSSRSGASFYNEVRKKDGLLTPRSLTCVVMNLISAGYILLPHAFAQAGVILSSVVLLLVIMQTYISGNFILVAGAHAEALNVFEGLGGNLPKNYSFALRNRKYEVSHLYQIFMTKAEAVFFTITTIGDLFGITWVLISIFAATLAESVPLSDDVNSYRIYLLIFVCFSVPLSCTSIIEQVWVQLVFLFFRMVMVLCMLGTIFYARMSTVFGDDEKPHFGELSGPVDDVPMVDFRGLIPLLMTSVFSTAYQFSVPNVSASARNIKKVPKVFKTAAMFIYTTNIAIAIYVSQYFGRVHTLDSSNLLWDNYHGGHEDNPPWWATLISKYVTLFAAIDGAAVYPMLAIALGDILMGTVYGDDVHEAEQNWKIRITFRLFGAIPQAIGAMFVSDLSFIARYSGVCTLLSYTTAPALLFLHSRKQVAAAKITTRTHYSTWMSSPFVAFFMVLLSFAIIGAVIVDTVWRRYGVFGLEKFAGY